MSPTLTSSAAMLSLVAPDRWVEAGEDEPVVVKAEPGETRAESRRANRMATMVQFVEHRTVIIVPGPFTLSKVM